MAITPPSSPPAKKARMHSPSHRTPDGNSEASTSKLQTIGQGRAKHSSTNVDKKKIKGKEKSRQAMLAKTGEEPIWFDIVEILGRDRVDQIIEDGRIGKTAGEWEDKFARETILEGTILRISANGAGLFASPDSDWVLAVPHALPGEKVKVRVDRNERLYSKCDLLEVLEKSDERRDDLIGCKYFGECSGCQYQMLPYEKQLELKREVVIKAFAHFSGLDASLIPAALPTLPSPKEYAYRTKLTPHFELPRSLMNFRRQHNPDKAKFRNRKGKKSAVQPPTNLEPEELEDLSRQWSKDTDIGFDQLKGGGKGILDIEECPIATAAINKALPEEKAKIKSSINSFPNGATLLLRDSLTAETMGLSAEDIAKDPVPTRDGKETPGRQDGSEVITSYRAIVREKVDETRFETPSGSFFQNNRAILPALVAYVREAIVSARTDVSSDEHFLVDTYCGSGLFTLMLAPLFEEAAGVEIDAGSIEFAKGNAKLNSMDNVKFLAGNAEDIFRTISYPADRTTVVIDPPRRGCDEAFIEQLVALSPSLIVYVSCNVHTQARDVGSFIRKAPDYEIASVRGADLFPQTYHVEGVCVLRKKATKGAVGA